MMTSRSRWLPLLSLALAAACGEGGVSAPIADPIVGGRHDLAVRVPGEARREPRSPSDLPTPSVEPGDPLDGGGDETMRPVIVSARTDVYLHDAVARAKATMEYYAMGATQTVQLKLFDNATLVGQSAPATSVDEGIWQYSLKTLITYTEPVPVGAPCGHRATGAGQHAAYNLFPNTSLSLSQFDRISTTSSGLASQPSCPAPPPPPPGDGGGGGGMGWEICYWWVEYDEYGYELRRTKLYCESI